MGLPPQPLRSPSPVSSLPPWYVPPEARDQKKQIHVDHGPLLPNRDSHKRPTPPPTRHAPQGSREARDQKERRINQTLRQSNVVDGPPRKRPIRWLSDSDRQPRKNATHETQVYCTGMGRSSKQKCLQLNDPSLWIGDRVKYFDIFGHVSSITEDQDGNKLVAVRHEHTMHLTWVKMPFEGGITCSNDSGRMGVSE